MYEPLVSPCKRDSMLSLDKRENLDIFLLEELKSAIVNREKSGETSIQRTRYQYRSMFPRRAGCYHFLVYLLVPSGLLKTAGIFSLSLGTPTISLFRRKSDGECMCYFASYLVPGVR